MQIVVNQARAILVGKIVLVPGLNEVSEELFRKEASKPAARTALEQWAKAGVLEIAPKGVKAKAADTGPGLGGLSVDKALEIISACSDTSRLEKWFKDERRDKVRRALAARADELKKDEA